ncbi:MAG: alpha/beta fold hydrolase [Caryophanon sp.]|nr:alpha/beta fold hydrolase [Caryophanon sp.]
MKIGVLCIHGFSGGPYEVQPFADFLKRQTTWEVVVPTLPGHGDVLSMRGHTHHEWLMAAELAYRALARRVDRVIVVGFSMGGLIAMYLAKRYRVHKLVLLSAALKYASPMQLTKDIREMAQHFRKRTLKQHELYKRYATKLRDVPIQSTFEFMKLVALVKPFYATITAPTFIVQGEHDGIVPNKTAALLYETLQCTPKRLYISPVGKHHICYSADCNDWFEEVYRFLCE